jgi:signal transduction histidine kinase
VTGISKLVGRVRDLDRARIDAFLAALLAAGTELQVWLSHSIHDRPATAVAGLVLCGAVAVRRRWPLGAVLAGSGAVSVDAALGGALVVSGLAALPAGFLCFYGAGAFLPGRRSRIALGAGLVVLMPQILLTPHVVSNLFFEPTILVFAPWLIGRWLREHAARARRFRALSEQLDAEREQHVSGAVDRERIRIAQELHDVIGHCLSVIVLRAGGARVVVEGEPERAREAMRVVERAGREALGEMRHLLGVFGSERIGEDRHSQPGLASIEDLVARTRASGLETELTVNGRPREVPPALALCIYRIVQEGLTNTIKHAGRHGRRYGCRGTRTASSSRSPTTGAVPAASATGASGMDSSGCASVPRFTRDGFGLAPSAAAATGSRRRCR